MLRITRIDNPEEKAEGLCNGVPYTTNVYGSNGCHIHFWINDSCLPNDFNDTLRMAVNSRDVVKATYSYGVPTGFWAHQNIEE